MKLEACRRRVYRRHLKCACCGRNIPRGHYRLDLAAFSQDGQVNRLTVHLHCSPIDR